MPTTNYDTVNGRIRGQSTGGVHTDFLTDALGNVTATIDDTGAVVNTYRYKPSGQQLAKTGVGADPKFLWNGETGSRTTGLGGSDYYNRARHYGSSHATWTTVDPLWPIEPAYIYVEGNPTTWNDPFGKQLLHRQPPKTLPDIGSGLEKACGAATRILAQGYNDPDVYRRINNCVAQSGNRCRPVNQQTLNCLAKYACTPASQINIKFNPAECNNIFDAPCAHIVYNPPDTLVPGAPPGMQKKSCQKGPDGRFDLIVCPDLGCSTCNPLGSPVPVTQGLSHEILHCCGLEHGPYPEPETCNSITACCILKEVGLNPPGHKCY